MKRGSKKLETDNVNNSAISNIKSYKLNKTLENSIYPLELELKEINNNTISNSLNNLVGIVFSGIGTSVLLNDSCVLELLEFIYNICEIPAQSVIRASLNCIIVISLFILFYFVGLLINGITKKKSRLYKKKGTSKGRSELREIFHKSIINDIVIGISFVDKAEEIGYDGDVAEMYLYEAAYYFIQAKIQMEEMELLDPEKNEEHEQFISEIGLKTIESTCKVFYAGLKKLYNKMAEGKEKRDIKNIIESIKPYLQDMSYDFL